MHAVGDNMVFFHLMPLVSLSLFDIQLSIKCLTQAGPRTPDIIAIQHCSRHTNDAIRLVEHIFDSLLNVCEPLCY